MAATVKTTVLAAVERVRENGVSLLYPFEGLMLGLEEKLAVMESLEEGLSGVVEERENRVDGRRWLQLDLGRRRKEEDMAMAESIR